MFTAFACLGYIIDNRFIQSTALVPVPDSGVLSIKVKAGQRVSCAAVYLNPKQPFHVDPVQAEPGDTVTVHIGFGASPNV